MGSLREFCTNSFDFDAISRESDRIGAAGDRPRSASEPDFNDGVSGWGALIGNYEDRVDAMLPEYLALTTSVSADAVPSLARRRSASACTIKIRRPSLNGDCLVHRASLGQD